MSFYGYISISRCKGKKSGFGGSFFDRLRTVEVENRGKIDVKLVENMRRGYMRAARFVGN